MLSRRPTHLGLAEAGKDLLLVGPTDAKILSNLAASQSNSPDGSFLRVSSEFSFGKDVILSA